MISNTNGNPSIAQEKIFVLNEKPLTQKCALNTCNKINCRRPWHKPCVLAKLGLAEKLKPMLAVVGGMEIFIGIIILVSMVLYGHDYDTIFGTNLKVISLACLNGSIALVMTGFMLITSVYWDIRRLMLVHVFVSTLLGLYFFVVSILKIHYGLLIIKKETPDASCRQNQSFLTNAACLMGLLTMLGSAVHCVGNIVVFAYYNLKYIQPCIFKSVDT